MNPSSPTAGAASPTPTAADDYDRACAVVDVLAGVIAVGGAGARPTPESAGDRSAVCHNSVTGTADRSE
ncbi:hypothetical protein OG592_32030 [Streptomyces avidinii]|uniref:hypothetical protein n=1 Tax=Streptomyces avidinii TaxID=1895 RepID=UPI00386BADA5|nr:hypothetical protein OG592_32030 [Streptomyces avidinii]